MIFFVGGTKLSFRLFQDQVRSYHFDNRIEATRQYFYFLHIFIGKSDNEKPFWILIWIHYYLLNGIGLDWHLRTTLSRHKTYLTLLLTTLALVINTQCIIWAREIRRDCINNCLRNNSRKSLYFSETKSFLFPKTKCFLRDIPLSNTTQ